MKKFLLGVLSVIVLSACTNAVIPNSVSSEGNLVKENINSEVPAKTGNDMTFKTEGYVCTSLGYGSYYSYDSKKRVYYSYCKKYKYYAPRTNYGGGGTRG